MIASIGNGYLVSDVPFHLLCPLICHTGTRKPWPKCGCVSRHSANTAGFADLIASDLNLTETFSLENLAIWHFMKKRSSTTSPSLYSMFTSYPNYRCSCMSIRVPASNNASSSTPRFSTGDAARPSTTPTNHQSRPSHRPSKSHRGPHMQNLQPCPNPRSLSPFTDMDASPPAMVKSSSVDGAVLSKDAVVEFSSI